MDNMECSSAGKHLYTSFEGNSPKRVSPAEKSDYLGCGRVELSLNKSSTVCFFGRTQFLSNFYHSPYNINGHIYPTVEQYYEACKIRVLLGPDYVRQLIGVSDPGKAKSISKRLTSAVPSEVKERWRQTEGIRVVRLATQEKFRQNPDLLQQLLDTDDHLLVQCNLHDSLWAVGMDGDQFTKWISEHEGQTIEIPREVRPETVQQFPLLGNGKNLLGFLIMNIREELREEKATQHRIPARSPLLKCPPFSQGFVAPESVDWMQM